MAYSSMRGCACVLVYTCLCVRTKFTHELFKDANLFVVEQLYKI